MRPPAYALIFALLFFFQTIAQAAQFSGTGHTLTSDTTPQDSFLLLAKKGGKHGGDDDDDGGGHPGKGKKKWKKKHGDDDDDDGHRGKGKRGKHRKHHKHHKHHKHDYHSKDWRPYHNKRLPAWAQDCGLPPGLAKQNKIPPGWEKKCRRGYKYYEHEADFRRDIEQEYGSHKGKVDRNSPTYQTLFKMDDAACKVNALEEVGSVAEGVAKGAVFGGVLGAATGVLIEAVQEDGNQESGAIYGATGGAAGGAVLGGILASENYKDHYRKCMRSRGHRVN